MTKPPEKAKPSMQDLLALVLERGASDLHLKAGQPPFLRIRGSIEPTELARLGGADVLELAGQVMDERSRRQFDETGGADFSHRVESGERFRINVYRQRGWASVAVRHVSRTIPTFEELHLPAQTLQDICETRHGLVIFAGVTGSGKSTSIAACLEYVNQHRRCHVVTIEDPIEYVFEDKQAIFNQREIGADVPTFPLALKYLAREDPDVVLVGEMRDRETCESVIRVAEGTGRLVFTTLHAPRAGGAITRILDLFSTQDLHVVRQVVAANLVAVVCQKLLPSLDPNTPRVPATEVLLATPGVRKMILEGEEQRLVEVIASGLDARMHDFTQDLARLVREEWAAPKDAYEAAPNPEALKMAIRGIAVK